MAWAPPLGVPAPSFGIVEVAGPFTHYVDNTHPATTDTSNPNGSPGRPRLTVPTSLPAGSVVEVRGGPYGGSDTTWRGSGTASHPVFIKGVGNPIFQSARRSISGSYVVVEGLVVEGAPVRLSGNHISVRNSEIRNYVPGRHSAAIAGDGNDFVVYNNHIHHNGDAGGTSELDVHGIKMSTGTLRLWIVDNHIHHNGGDSVQIGDQVAREPWARYVYIARNNCHEDRENAVDIKQARDVIISQNQVWGYRPPPGATSSDGSALVVHDDPERVWILFNEIRDSANGVRNNGSTVSYIIGNLIHNIHHEPQDDDYDADDVWSAGAAIISWRTGELHIVNNTLFDVDAGISYPGNGGKVQISNNIIAALAQPSHHVAISEDGVARLSTLHHTLMQAPARIKWTSSRRVYGISGFESSFPGQCDACLEAQPAFVSARDLRLRPESPAVDAGVPNPAYAFFQSLYGLNIAKDFAGAPRPNGRAFDLGAYER